MENKLSTDKLFEQSVKVHDQVLQHGVGPARRDGRIAPLLTHLCAVFKASTINPSLNANRLHMISQYHIRNCITRFLRLKWMILRAIGIIYFLKE